MSSQSGVFTATKKDGTIYYRASITYHSKHISLGSFASQAEAGRAYTVARMVLDRPKSHIIDPSLLLASYKPSALSFDKWVTLVNFRDNGLYIKTPIYLQKKYFLYFLSPQQVLKFNADDLFYYSNHRILQKKGYLYVNDYGSQISILSRYGVRPYAVPGRDYFFANGDCNDFTYGNIQVRNRYFGVEEIDKNGRKSYRAKIHVNGNFIIGTYPTEAEAAIAYNKAVDTLSEKGFARNYPLNYIESLSSIDYATIYNRVRISKKIRGLQDDKK